MRDSAGAHSTFDNLAFWEHRYQTDLELGSGGGSRGTFLKHKQELLQRLIDEQAPSSILDVGCGDIEVSRGFEFTGTYTGIDLSPTIIERNRRLRPGWQFVQGDFLQLAHDGRLRADLVICFDVLIHQHDPQIYRAFVDNLVAAAAKSAVLTGFERLPRSGKLSPNVAFHEPLTVTLSSIDGIDVRILGPFRNMHVVQVIRRAE
jgi:SAM-dependent methyltransferase